MQSVIKVTISDEKLRNIFKGMSGTDFNRVLESAILYYARHIEENAGVEDYVYDRHIINSEDCIEVKQIANLSKKELKAEALYCLDAYIDGKILVKSGALKNVLDELVTRRKFSTYPPKNIEVKEYKKSLEAVGFRYSIHNERVRRILTCVTAKSSYIDVFIENALEYYINFLKQNPIVMDARLDSRI